ncbi:hypothetical protein L596_010252 [Steinernema carpocapsae]|uniref:Uncharacterized protein n=1 Tax=Steinernema carpocapsae TaxID=34508 RepID=A0A4U5PHS5_STECR|nr:hypothetical protein L596_010252 [Steinernema carpocapsae]
MHVREEQRPRTVRVMNWNSFIIDMYTRFLSRLGTSDRLETIIYCCCLVALNQQIAKAVGRRFIQPQTD